MATFPTEQDDVLTDTPGNDGIDALGGNDEITVTNGIDSVNGGAGTDTLTIDYRASSASIGNNGGPTSDGNGGFSGQYSNFSGRAVIYNGIERFVFLLGGGNDNITFASGNDRADGGAGVDILNGPLSAGGAAVDFDIATDTRFSNFERLGSVTASPLADRIVTGRTQQNDSVSTGDGDDTITVSHGIDSVSAGAGLDTLIIDYAETSNPVGNNGGPTAGADGFGGQFSDFTGRAVVYSGVDRFIITAGSGNDNITTGSGDDEIRTGLGNDVVNVGAGIDIADGGDGTDTLGADFSDDAAGVAIDLRNAVNNGAFGQFSNFERFAALTASPFADTIITRTEALNDGISLGAGDDEVTVFNGIDNVAGGAGTDTLTIDYRATANAVGNNGGPTSDGDGGFGGQYSDFNGRTVVYSGIERFVFLLGSGNDNITVATGADRADGGAGIDILNGPLAIGGAAVDFDIATDTRFSNFERLGSVTASQLADRIVTGRTQQSDSISTGDGDDTITLFHGGDVVTAGAGIDTLIVDYAESAGAVQNNGGPSGSADGFSGQFNDFAGRVVSYSGVDRFLITSGVGADNITTGSGNDEVRTGAGNDVVNVGTGVDIADGGDGTDALAADFTEDSAGVAIDLRNAVNSGVFGSFSNFERFNGIVGSGLSDSFITRTEALNDSITLGAGDDNATIFNGIDSVAGGAGTDTLTIDYRASVAALQNNGGPSAESGGGFTGQFNDFSGRAVNYSGIERFVISAGSGNDILTTGSGDDVIEGGAGNDTLNAGDGVDTLSYENATGGVAISLSVTAAQITGGAGTDTISNFENLIGSAFADSLTGNGVANRIEGRAGNDNLSGLAGNDELDGGVGNDEVSGGLDNDTVRVSGPGFDIARGDGGVDTLLIDYRDVTDSVTTAQSVGGQGFDGGYRNGNLSGMGGDRTILFNGFERFEIRTGSGNDQIFAPNGASIIETGAGNDLVDEMTEFFSNQVVDAGSGDDQVTFRGGVDAADGGDGRDSITLIYDPNGAAIVNGVAPAGFDLRFEAGARGSVDLKNFEVIRIFLGSGNDVITTGASDDDIRESAFSSGATGDDVLSTGAGNDFFEIVNGNDVIDAGDGLDSASIDYADSAVAVLSVAPPTGFDFRYEAGASRSVSLKGVENINIFSGSGNDVLITGAGRDFLAGGAGNDVLDGGLGNDTLRGEAGDDILRVAGPGRDTVEGGALGDDLLEINYSDATARVVNIVTQISSGFESIGTVDQNDRRILYNDIERFNIRTGSGDDDIGGGSGDDIIDGGSGDDRLNDIQSGKEGSSGDDFLRGGIGNDILTVRDGADKVDGGEGRDFLHLAYGSSTSPVVNGTALPGFDARFETGDGRSVDLVGIENVTLSGGSGNDIVTAPDLPGLTVIFFGFGGLDTLTGGAGDDFIDGGAGNDQLNGGGGNDQVYGGAADDRVDGGSGNDSLFGDAGVDTLIGGDGDDILDGGAGIDVAIGGAGNDGFYFGAGLTAAEEVDGGEGTLDQVGLQGNYAGLTLGANNLVGIEQIVLLPGSDDRFGDISGAFYDYNLTTIDANVAAGQRLVVTANTLRAGEDVAFDGSAESDGFFLYYGGLGVDVVTGGQGDDGFFFGIGGRFGAGDRVDGQGGTMDQLGLQGDYSGADAVTFGANQIANVEMLVLLTGGDARFGNNGVGYSYDLTMNDGNVLAGQNLVISANTLRSDEKLTFDGSAESDGRFTIFSGDGADDIIGGAGDDVISGRGGADILAGGAGADTFLYTAASDSTGTSFDRVVGFDYRNDRIDLPTAVGHFSDAVEGSLSMATFDQDLAAALNGILGIGEAAVFQATSGDMAGRFFGIVDANGIAGYQAGEDYVVEFVDPVEIPTDPTIDFLI